MASVFDPLGLYFFFTLRMRILLKMIWTGHGQSWEQKLLDEDEEVFRERHKELPEIKEKITFALNILKLIPTFSHMHRWKQCVFFHIPERNPNMVWKMTLLL